MNYSSGLNERKNINIDYRATLDHLISLPIEQQIELDANTFFLLMEIFWSRVRVKDILPITNVVYAIHNEVESLPKLIKLMHDYEKLLMLRNLITIKNITQWKPYGGGFQ